MSHRIKYNVSVPESLGTDQLVIDPECHQTTITNVQDRTMAVADGNSILKLIRNRSGGEVKITFSPGLRDAATDKAVLQDGKDIVCFYQGREDDTNRWLDVGGDYTKE